MAEPRMTEVKRIANFEFGEVTCECGERFYLFFNGGELDRHECKCGLEYRTEIVQVDLVAYREASVETFSG